jgi:hypothetical protein
MKHLGNILPEVKKRKEVLAMMHPEHHSEDEEHLL